MPSLISRLNLVFRPFPAARGLGVIAFAFFIGILLTWPDTSESGAKTDAYIPISLLTLLPSSTGKLTKQSSEFNVSKDVVQAGDSLSRLFARQKLTAQLLVEIIRGTSAGDNISNLKVGQQIEFRFDKINKLQELAIIHSPFHQTVAKRYEANWLIEERHRDPEIHIEYARASIESSLFLAGARAGLPDNLIMELSNIYGYVIDFVYEIRKGDSFVVTFEKRYLDGKFIEYGNILAAKFINSGETFLAVRYTDQEGDTGYFDQEGISLKKAFLRAPLNFRRISSNFKLSRKHPILGKMRAHKGTDYAASTGTPIYAAGDGKVIFRGTKGGYGRTVILKHGNNIETRYAHLSRYGNYKTGKKVSQGQVIGYVGASGLATGPHLHYEFIVNGTHRNPRTVFDKLPKAKTLPRSEITHFEGVTEALIASLKAQQSNAELAFQNHQMP